MFVECKRKRICRMRTCNERIHQMCLQIERENTAIETEIDIVTQHRLSFVIQRRYVHIVHIGLYANGRAKTKTEIRMMHTNVTLIPEHV